MHNIKPITIHSRLFRLIVLFFLISSSCQLQATVKNSLYEMWKRACLNEINRAEDIHQYTDWQITNARVLVEHFDSTIFLQLDSTIHGALPTGLKEQQLYILFYYVNGEVFSNVLQFVVVVNEKYFACYCLREAGDTIYSTIEEQPLSEWKNFLQQLTVRDSQLLDNSFFIISSVINERIDCKVVEIGFQQDYIINKWFFSRN